MCDKEQLVAYLYDDLSAADRAAFDGHLAACAACREELAALGATRRHLTRWSPPEPEFNVRVVRGGAPAPSARGWRTAVLPQWGLAAAAALLLLAGAAALANIEVRYDANGFAVRTGWGGEPPAPAAPAAVSTGPAAALPAADPAPASEEWKAAIVALERRLQQIEGAQAARTARTVTAGAPAISPAELRGILEESEARTRAEIAVQMAQLWKDVNAARRSDFVQVQRTLAPEFQRQQRQMNNLMMIHATSTSPQK